MEQEPVYVPSAKLTSACEDALGRIYTHRQENREQYVRARTDEYNQAVTARNAKWAVVKRWLGRAPESLITPQGMELQIKAEVDSLSADMAAQHPMIQIHSAYGRLEHEAKDAIVMARLTDAVPISADFARGLSHLGIDPGYMRKAPFGFAPR